MNTDKYERSNRIFILSLWIIPIVFYLVFWILDGAVWCADSDSYVGMHDCREPLYPMMLAALRFLLGVGKEANPESNISLIAMAFIQSILAGISTGSLISYIARTYLKESIFNGTVFGRRMYTEAGLVKCWIYAKKQRIVAYVLLAVPLVVSLINRFLAGRSSMYSNSILTEGIAISIYLLVFRFILEYMIEGSKYAYKMCCLTVLIGITLRKQMYVLLCLFIIAMIYREFITDKNRGRLLRVVTALILIVGAGLLIDCAYNKVIRDVFIIHTEDNRFVTTMALYTSEREYVQYIDPQLQGIYLQIYDACDVNKWLMHDAPSGFSAFEEHFANNYDHIQLDTMQLMLEDYVKSNSYSGFTDSMTKTEKLDVIRSSFNKSLIPHETDRLLIVFGCNFLNGLINTVAKRHFILSVYAAIIYILFIVAAFGVMKKNRENNILVTLTVLSILGNVTLVAAVIFTQTRYTIYNMPLFYITLILMLYDGIKYREIREKNRRGESGV